MREPVRINMAEMAVGHNDMTISTGSIGSCVVIMIYDREAGVGGMAHAMLPSRAGPSDGAGDIYEAKAKYADESVDRLISEIEKMGGEKRRLSAKLVGGARMFKVLGGDRYGIGYKNVESARKRLQELGIPIESEDVGGSTGKTARFNIANGVVEVLTKM